MDRYALMVLALQTGAGPVVGLTIKYADNIVKTWHVKRMCIEWARH